MPISTLHSNAPAGDEQPVQDHGRQVTLAAFGSSDAQRIGPVAVPVQQADHRPLVLRGAQGEVVTMVEFDVDLLLIGAAVGKLDHHLMRRRRIGLFVLLPLVDSGHDRFEVPRTDDIIGDPR